MPRWISAAGLLAVAACATSRVSVTDTGVAIALAPRPPDCRIEFYRTKPPERAYDEVSALHFSGRATAAGAQEAIRAKACELGADAVIVTREYVEVALGGGVVVGQTVVVPTQAFMTGTAISYPDLRQRHRAEHAARQAELRAGFEKAVAAAERPADLPPGYVAARTKRGAVVRPTMDGYAPVGGNLELPAGQIVWVSPDSRDGYRHVAGSGYVEEDALELAPPAEPAAVPPPRSAPARTEI